MNQFAKIRLSGTIELASGLHIGGSTAFAAIGAIDSPVIKDPLTNLPIIPGSSLRKIRVFWQKRITTDRSEPNEVFHGSRLFGATSGEMMKTDYRRTSDFS